MNGNSHSPLLAATVSAIGLALTNDSSAGVFQPGEFVTYSQDSWGDAPSPGNAAQLLSSNFDFVYAANGLEAGINGPAGFSMVFTGASPLLLYLPASGGPGPLNADLVDPSSTSSGIFGGFLLAMQLNVDFNDAGLLTGSSAVLFGDLVLHDLTATPLYDGLSVRQFLVQMNAALGGTVPRYTYDDIALLTRDVTLAFEGGTPSQFAQDHLRLPCPADINGDNIVDVNDLLFLIGAWGSANPDADINDDGVVDVNDLLLLIGSWGAC